MTVLNNAIRDKKFNPTDAITMAKNLISLNTSTQQDIIDQLGTKIVQSFPPNSFPPQVVQAMAAEIYRQADHQLHLETESKKDFDSIETSDITLIEDIISQNAAAIIACFDTKKLPISAPLGSTEFMRLLIAFTAHALTSYHLSGWIKYNKKEIFTLAKLNRLSSSQQEELTQQIHNLFGLNMRVVGSNQPIPCYNLPWLVPPLNITEIISKLDPSKIVISLSAAIAAIVPGQPLFR